MDLNTTLKGAATEALANTPNTWESNVRIDSAMRQITNSLGKELERLVMAEEAETPQQIEFIYLYRLLNKYLPEPQHDRLIDMIRDEFGGLLADYTFISSDRLTIFLDDLRDSETGIPFERQALSNISNVIKKNGGFVEIGM